tara:strand:+ start:655 stop:1101 length:447 start_codon:yes stop_codon:yes gene_type:complete
MDYESYHTHPINKGIHIMAIPTIVFSSYNLLSLVKINIKIEDDTNTNIKFGLQKILMYLMLYNYLSYGIKPFLVMGVYFYIIDKLSVSYMKIKNCIRSSIYAFIYAWVIQFIGHAIEGNRPALLDGIIQSFTQAPLFSLNYILPFEVY